MNLLTVKVPIHKVNNNIIKRTEKFIDYTILLDKARISDYNQSILIPGRTAILNDPVEILKMDWETSEFNISFTQEKVMKEFPKFKNKKIMTGLLKDNELINELIDKTPIHINKDSIKQSLELIELNKTINSYEPIIPHNLLDEYMNAKKSIERIKTANINLNLAMIKQGFAFAGPSISMAKEGFSVKHWSEKNNYDFSGKSFYTLGQLGRLCIELDSLWNR